MMDTNQIKSVYFIGIGGIAMSAVSAIAKQKGFTVSGSDSKEAYSPSLEVLKENGLIYHKGYDASHIKDSKSDLYIISAGEDLGNPEVKYVYEHNLPHAGFAAFLYALSKDVLRIVVTGTHGKSTTSAILGHLLKNIDGSSYLAGAVFQQENNNFYLGDGHYFVFEGDEYKHEFDDPTPKFQYYKPDILVLTNLEYDHPDLFKSFEDLEKEFELLVANLPPDGLLVYNADDIHLAKLAQNTEVAKVSFGAENEADYRAVSIQQDGDYTVLEIENKFSKDLPSKLLGLSEHYKTQLPGKLYAYDALGAIACLRALGFSQQEIAINLVAFKGLKRRFEILGTKNGITIIDDYAHHPTAVKATLEAVRQRYFSRVSKGHPLFTKEGDGGSLIEDGGLKRKDVGRLWAIFEPHTFSRTEATISDLSKSFTDADEVLISEIYPAREKSKDFSITSQKVVEAIKASHPLFTKEGDGGSLNKNGPMSFKDERLRIKDNIRSVKDKHQALKILKDELKSGDVVIVMAVGDYNKLGYELLKTI